jgi:hypothetical protein
MDKKSETLSQDIPNTKMAGGLAQVAEYLHNKV